MASCSANWHLRKAIQKDPSLVRQDTVSVVDTVEFITERVETDSVFKLTTDTVVIRKDRLTIKHHYNNVTDSVYIEGECAEDTLIQYREVKVPVTKVIQKETDYIPYLILVGFVVALLLYNKIISKK